MDFLKLIYENNLILIPCLMVIGWIIKITDLMTHKYIPVTLIIIGIIMTPLLNLSTGFNTEIMIQSIIQGILVAGASIGFHQIPKQLTKGD